MNKPVLPKQKSIYREYPVPESLKNIALKLWSFRASSAGGGKVFFSLLPDFTTSIIHVKDTNTRGSKLIAYGPTLKKISIEGEKMAEAIGIRLKPHVILKNLNSGKAALPGSVTILSVKKYNAVLEELRNSRSKRSSLKTLERFILESSGYVVIRNKFITTVMDAVQRSHGNCRLENIYDGLDIGRRQIQRLFKKHCSIPPKEFLKLVRIHNAARELVKKGYDHFGVITELGYYDQSHYYREFRELLGINPGEFERRQKALKHENLVD